MLTGSCGLVRSQDTCFEDLLIYAGVIFAEKDYTPPDLTLTGANESSLARARSGSLSSALAQQQQQARENRSRSGSINASGPPMALAGYVPVPVLQPNLPSPTDFAPQSGAYGHPGSIHRGGHRRKISLRNEQDALGHGEGSDSSRSQPSSPPSLPPRSYPRSTAEGPMLPPPLPARQSSQVSSQTSLRQNSDELTADATPVAAEHKADESASTAQPPATTATSSTSSTPPPLGLPVPISQTSTDPASRPAASPGLVELARTGEAALDRLEGGDAAAPAKEDVSAEPVAASEAAVVEPVSQGVAESSKA